MIIKFRYLVLTGLSALALASVLVLPGIFAHLKNTPENIYYINNPDLAYTVFSGCKLHVDDVDRCYAAYSAGVMLADSTDCSPAGIAVKRRFKRLVEHNKEESITAEIISDCEPPNKPSISNK